MGDEYFDSVTLLLHFNGADASTTFTDSSNTGAVFEQGFTAPELDTAQKKFGSASLKCEQYDYIIGEGGED